MLKMYFNRTKIQIHVCRTSLSKPSPKTLFYKFSVQILFHRKTSFKSSKRLDKIYPKKHECIVEL